MPRGGAGAGEAGGTPPEPLLSPPPPQKVMEVMGVLAIVVNCYLIGQCGQLQRLFPWLSPEAAIVSVVVLEVGPVAGWGHQAVGPGGVVPTPAASSSVASALRSAPQVPHPCGHPRHPGLGG